MVLFNCETQFENMYRKVYRKVREANHQSLSYLNKYKLAKPLRVRQNVLLDNHKIPFGQSQKVFELQSGPYMETKAFKKVLYEIVLDSDPTKTQVVHRKHLVQYFPRDSELSILLSNYEKHLNDDKTDNFHK